MNETLLTPQPVSGIECIESWHNNDASLWYRIYSDDYVEQGGITSCSVDGTTYFIDLPIEMSNSNYVSFVEPNVTGNGFMPSGSTIHNSVFKKQSTGFEVYCNLSNAGLNPKAWYVCGFRKV